MKLEGTSLLDTVSEDAFFVRENTCCLPFFVVNLFRCREDNHNGDNQVKLKNVLVLPGSVQYFRHTTRCRMFYLYKGNTRMVKEVNL